MPSRLPPVLSNSTTAVPVISGLVSAPQFLAHLVQTHVWTQTLLERLKSPQGLDVRVQGAPPASLKALVLARLMASRQQPIVFVTHDPQTPQALQVALEALWPAAQLADQFARYPTELFSPYDLATIPTPILAAHYGFLATLANPKPQLLVINARNLVTRFPSLADRHRYGLHLTLDAELDPEDMVRQALAMGYHTTGLITEPGDISRRGDIVDVYPLNGDPVRCGFFGETVESIRQLDLASQRSVGNLTQVSILPRSALVLSPENRAALPDRMSDALQAQSQQLKGQDLDGLAATINNHVVALEQDFLGDGLDYYAPLVDHEWTSLAECLPADALWVLDDWEGIVQQVESLADRLDHQLEDLTSKGRLLALPNPTDPSQPLAQHLSASVVMQALQHPHHAARLIFDPFPVIDLQLGPSTKTLNAGKAVKSSAAKGIEPSGKVDSLVWPLAPLDRFAADLGKAVEAATGWRKAGLQVVLTTDYPQRVLDTCREHDLPAVYWSEDGTSPLAQLLAGTTGEGSRLPGLEVLIAKKGFPDSFHLPGMGVIHLTDAELFGRGKARRVVAPTKTAVRKDDVDAIASLAELRPGDYVVHVKHGIGQFIDLTRIKLDREIREYLTIAYKGNDKLFVPVEQVNLLSRYRGAGDTKPPLNKMGGADWSKIKTKVKTSVASIAHELVALYDARKRTKGHSFEPDSPWQVEMEESFPYQETPDQWQAIVDVKKDMEKLDDDRQKPMDRLICGDVGFGKTEVALRAAFKAVLSGKQCAVLVPTTILAQQHFNTFSQRFAPYGVRVGLLSRFRSPKEQQELVTKLRAGECDIVVGTHRVLQKDIVFKDLGLLIIDEEHRFGVSHKEKIKHMRTHVDALTLSATPIPRTLYMSLSGVREMSLINTPPVNRLPVQTLVGPYNPAQVRMAILQEVDRGGQVYYLHNRVSSIYAVAEQLKKLIPEVRIAVGHGQLNPQDLETVMLDFANQAFDVLMCTTIVESGVDIPNANTLIIDDADRYGLAQLYQIRGRVGRSEQQAYAYMYYSPDKQLTDDAKSRLRVIREFTALGSGYHIAMRDMEIRGVGNLLGADQHGHMVQVGFDMYADLLNQAVEAAQQGKPIAEDRPEPSIVDLNVTAFIPEEWVGGDRDVKLSEYKRLAAIDSEKGLDLIVAQWQDRFGPVPAQAVQLVNLARLRVMATELGIPLVRNDDEHLRITVSYGLQDWMKVQNTLKVKQAAKLRWIAPVRSSGGGDSSGGLPTLLLKHAVLSGTEQVQFLLAFFKELKGLKSV